MTNSLGKGCADPRLQHWEGFSASCKEISQWRGMRFGFTGSPGQEELSSSLCGRGLLSVKHVQMLSVTATRFLHDGIVSAVLGGCHRDNKPTSSSEVTPRVDLTCRLSLQTCMVAWVGSKVDCPRLQIAEPCPFQGWWAWVPGSLVSGTGLTFYPIRGALCKSGQKWPL